MSRTPAVCDNCYISDEIEELMVNVREIMDTEKGVLGLDAHSPAFTYPFSDVNRNNDWETRRLYRQFISSAPLQEQFSAALLSEEFIKQSNDETIEFIEILMKKGLLVGVRIDFGISPIIGTINESIGVGMERISERLKLYKERGCKYSKWRSVYQIKENIPTLYGTQVNCLNLASFATISQSLGLVPIVSVEVLPDGSEDINKAGRVLEKILINLIKKLNDFNVILEATILQVSFVQAGRSNINSDSSPKNIAEHTLDAFKKSLPVALGGIMFHSSGLSEELATQTLNNLMIIKLANEMMAPWKMTHSFGRAQQASALQTWRGNPDFEEAGQNEIMNRGFANNEALLGRYKEKSVQGRYSENDLFIPNYLH